MGRVAAKGKNFGFAGTVWLWNGDSPWHFVSLPSGIADEIEDLTVGRTRGFGSVRVEVTSDDLTWRTSIFPDRKTGTFLLPLKKQVRQQLGCEAGTRVRLSLRILDD